MTQSRSLAIGVAAALVLAAAGDCGGTIADDTIGAVPIDGGDAARDARGRDVGPPDSQGDDDAGDDGPVTCDQGVCPSPMDVTGFAPTWKPPTGAHQNACTAALIDQFYQDCLSTNGSQSCTTFTSGDAAHKACASCIQSRFTDAKWAALVSSTNVVETNTSGCIALLDPTQTDCAKAVQALDQCEHAACDPVCGGGGASNFDGWVTCSAVANTCGCKPFFDAADCVKKIASSGGPAAPCLVGKTFEDYFYVTAGVFCGP